MSSTWSRIHIVLINFFIHYLINVHCNVINLDQNSFDELTKNSNTTTKFIYGFQVPNGDNMRYVQKFLEFETRLQSRLQRFDVTADVFAINCLNDRVDQICFDKKSEFHVLHGYHNDQTFTQQLNPTERISERFIIKEALKFVNPGHIDGCEDIILNSIHFEDPLVQDDEMEVKWYQNRKKDTCFSCPLDFKNLKPLCKKSLDTFLTNNTFTMVLFHANVDIASRSLLEEFIHASTLTSDQTMGALSCTEWPDVCERHQIYSWPQIWFYKNGQMYKQYKMPYVATIMAKSLDLLNFPTVTLLTNEADLDSFTSGQKRKLQLPAVTMGFFDSKMSSEYKAFEELADQVHGYYVLGAVFDSTAKSWVKLNRPDLNVPTLVTFVSEDDLPISYSSKKFDVEEMRKFLKQSSMPSLVELNSKSFPSLAFDNELLIITILPEGRENFFYENLKKLAKSGSFLMTKFAFVDKSNDQILACKLMKSYYLKSSRTMPTIVGLRKGSVFVYESSDEQTFEFESVSSWINDIQTNKILPSITLKPLGCSTRPMVFDYLDLIYSSKMPMQQTKTSSISNSTIVNKHQMKMKENKIINKDNENKSSIKRDEL